MRKNLVLLGFMGSGKTSTGKALAQKTGYRFLDTDVEIERREGRSVREIFREKGEAAFRALERALLDEWLEADGQVLATGGGMWMDPSNRERLLASGWCIWLKAGPDQTWERVKEDLATRPRLASSSDPKGKVAELIVARTPLYSLAHSAIDTDGLTPEEVADRILDTGKGKAPFDLPTLP